MKTIMKRATVAIVNFCLLIGSTCMNVSCTNDELGAGLGIIFGDNGVSNDPDCEIEFDFPELKWQSNNFNGSISIMDEVDGVLLVFESEARALIGMDKSNGKTLWRATNLNLPYGDFLKSYSLENEMLLYWDHHAIRLDVHTGELMDSFEAEFSFLSLVYQNGVYYAYSNPHDDSRPFGMYRRAAGSNEAFVLYHQLDDVDYQTAALLPLIITKNSLGEATMVLAINYTTKTFELKTQLTAINLDSNEILWNYFRNEGQNKLEVIQPQLTAKSTLIICRTDFMEAVDVDDGTQRWESYVNDQRFSPAKLFIDGNRAFVNGPYGGFHGCFDLYDGRLIWTYNSAQVSPVFIRNGKMIWDDPESSNLRIVNIADGLPGELLPQPWPGCSPTTVSYLENKKHNDQIIVAYTKGNIVGLAY